MTVKELIDYLTKMPQESTIQISSKKFQAEIVSVAEVNETQYIPEDPFYDLKAKVVNSKTIRIYCSPYSGYEIK